MRGVIKNNIGTKHKIFYQILKLVFNFCKDIKINRSINKYSFYYIFEDK